jgi:uncharacterized surface anchored protein
MRLACCLLVSAFIASGQQPSAPQTFTLSGTVVDAATQTALPGAEVQVSPVGKPQLIENVIADGTGRFTFNNLFAGKYSLSSAHAGYLSETFQQHGGYSTGIAVGANLSSKDLVFPLHRGAVISGFVTDQDNEPVPNAQIELLRESVVGGLRTVTRGGWSTTGNDGHYSTQALRPGIYFLGVVAQPWYAQQYMAVGSRTHVETDGSNKLDVAYPITYYPGVTDDRSAAALQLTPGSRIEANIALTAVPAAHVTFERSNGANLNARLQIANRWGVPMLTRSMYFSQQGQLFSVAPGRYRVVAGWRDATGRHSTQRVLNVQGSLTIDPRSMADDRVIAATVQEKTGIPDLPRGSLVLRDLNTSQVWPAMISKNEGIRWSADELTATRYELILSGPEDTYIDQVSATNARVTSRTIELGPSGPVQLKITLARGQASMHGKVEQNGRPVAAAMVLLLREDFAYAPSLIRRDQSDSDGTFSLSNIVPGHYTLLALPTNEDLEYARADVMQPFLGSAKKLTIERDMHYEETIQLTGSLP